MKTCRYCAEEIQDEATVCPHCGKNLKPSWWPIVLGFLAALAIVILVAASIYLFIIYASFQ